jgi:hypothetical protein
MAIYHFSVKPISRADGRSAVAAAAYRSAEKLDDARYGKIQDYTRKTGVELSKIYAPDNVAPSLLNRNELWNAVEKSENRKDACLAREFEIAFPSELNQHQREKMLDDLCNQLVTKYGVVVDAAIHAPDIKGGSDERNFHAHILFTTRSIDPSTGFFSSTKYRDFNKPLGSETTKAWREYFATLTNSHLAKAGHDARVDHRSYEAQGLELEATQHEGPEVTQLRRQGIETEISLKNDLIKQRNAETLQLPELIKGLEQEIVATEKLKSRLEADLLEMEKREKLEAENRAAAEKARLEAEKQRLEAERLEAERLEAEQLDRDVSRFYEVQQRYADFTYTMLDLHSEKESKINKILKTREKIENFVAKCPPNDSIIRKEETAYELKKGYVPDFYISKESARSQINKIEKDYENELQVLAKETGFLKTASELKILHQSLTSKGVELEIPREKKILGITITATPPSAETLDVDLKIYYFEPLGYDFESAYNRAIRSEAQKKKDDEADRKAKREQAANSLRYQQERLEAIAKETAIIEALDQLRRDCGYRPDFKYDALGVQVKNLSSLMLSDVRKGKDVSDYLAEKIELFERELKANRSEIVYGQIFELLDADKRLLKDDAKNINKINSFHDKLKNHVAEKKEIEQLRLERGEQAEHVPVKNTENRKSFDNNSNDFPM